MSIAGPRMVFVPTAAYQHAHLLLNTCGGGGGGTSNGWAAGAAEPSAAGAGFVRRESCKCRRERGAWGPLIARLPAFSGGTTCPDCVGVGICDNADAAAARARVR